MDREWNGSRLKSLFCNRRADKQMHQTNSKANVLCRDTVTVLVRIIVAALSRIVSRSCTVDQQQFTHDTCPLRRWKLEKCTKCTSYWHVGMVYRTNEECQH
jgi:hypothetical protein